MAFERYIWSGNKRLRLGYTTGTCAAAAAGAAARALLFGESPASVTVRVPAGEDIEVDVVESCRGTDSATCAVRKDAGDDVDATDGALICARVELTDWEGVEIDGGAGVGRVTKPGLDQPVGAAAINSVPRRMIAQAVEGVLAQAREDRGAAVTIIVPMGEEIAAKTFNPNLGIVGGISILGTTGVVEPRSLSALRDSIELEIRQAAALGASDLVVVPGNYGSDYVSGNLRIGATPVVACSNFMGDAIDCAVREGFERVLVVGHIGKMVKVCGGVMDTHSRVADARMEILAAHAAASGAPAERVRQIMEAATADAGLGILEHEGLVASTCESLSRALSVRLDRRAGGAVSIAAIVFSNVYGELFRTSGADEMLASWEVAHG